MKKIISMLAALAMIATMITSVASAAATFTPTVTSTVTGKVSAEDFYSVFEEAIPTGYTPYAIKVDLSNLGTYSMTKSANKWTGTAMNVFEYNFTFSDADLAKINTDYTCIAGGELTSAQAGFQGNVGCATTGALDGPTAVHLAGEIENALTIWLLVEDGEQITANLSVACEITEYNKNTAGDSVTGVATLSPAKLTIGGATGLPESGTTVVSETTLDSSATQAIDNVTTYPATVGSAKILKNYAIDKVTFAPAKGSLGKYYLKATDDKGNTKVWKMFTADSKPDATDETHDGFTDHAGGKIETQIKNGEITEASFYIMIRSANHKIAKYEVYTAE